MDDLSRQLVDHPRFQWRCGMVRAGGALVVDVLDHHLLLRDGRSVYPVPIRGALPKLDDPGTLGHLRSMIEGFRYVKKHANASRWDVVALIDNRPTLLARAPTEGEAIVRALLTQWRSDDG